MPEDNIAEFRDDMSVLSEGSDATPERLPAGDKTTPPPQQAIAEETEEFDKELAEESEEIEEEAPSPEEPEVVPAHARPTLTQIKEKYPNFFKDFPDMRHVFFREGEYTNIFPTVDDAKDAAERAESFTNFSELVSSGTPENFTEFLKGVDGAGPNALKSMAANFLPSLYSTNRDLYYNVTQPIVETILRNAFTAGDENLKNSALHIAKWAFGDTRYASGEMKTEQLKPAAPQQDEALNQERQQWFQQKYDDVHGTVNTTAHSRLDGEIRQGLDPNGVFNEFTSNLLVDRIFQEIGAALEADQRHMGNMNSLWKHAGKAGFAGNWKDRLLSTYLSGARAIMPAIRARVRNEALGDVKNRAQQTERVARRSAERREVPGQPGAPRPNGQPSYTSKDIDWKNTSDMDFLNGRVTTRK